MLELEEWEDLSREVSKSVRAIGLQPDASHFTASLRNAVERFADSISTPDREMLLRSYGACPPITSSAFVPRTIVLILPSGRVVLCADHARARDMLLSTLLPHVKESHATFYMRAARPGVWRVNVRQPRIIHLEFVGDSSKSVVIMLSPTLTQLQNIQRTYPSIRAVVMKIRTEEGRVLRASVLRDNDTGICYYPPTHGTDDDVWFMVPVLREELPPHTLSLTPPTHKRMRT